MRSTTVRAAAAALVALFALAGCEFSGATGRVVQDDGTCTEIELPAVEVSVPTAERQLPGPILRPCPTTTPPTTAPPTTTTAPPPTTTPPATTTPPPTTNPPPPPAGTGTFEAEVGAPWVFTGAWATGAGDRYTRQPGATATLQVTGTTIRLFGVRAPHHGIATVALDGGPAVDVDGYAATRQESALLWISPVLADASHTLVVTMTNRRNPAASVDSLGAAFSLDRAVVTTGTATPPPTTPPPTTTTPPTTPPGAQPLVTRDGRTLEIAGERWKFAGLNADTWLGCWDGENGRTTAAALDRFFGELHDSSLTRVWVYRSDPNSIATLRRIVTAAEQHDQYLMVTLSDGNTGGTQCGSLKGSGYPADGGPVLAHARALVPQFAASPAIAFWEIINEGTTNASAASWYRTIGTELGRLDPDTLVVGGAGTCWNGTPISACQAVNDPAWNDMVNMHEYDYSNGGVSHHAQNTEALAASLGLPWFSGESGFCCNGGPSGLTEAGAADLLAREWTAYLTSPGSAGMLYWDHKWAYNSPSTINLGDPAWRTAAEFRHQWQ